MKEEMINIEIPVAMAQGEGYFVIFNTDETDKLIGKTNIVVQGDSIEDAKSKYLWILKSHIDYMEKRSNDLNKWKSFQKGDWKHIGGTWFTLFGFNVFFRRGKNMKGGWYVPLTNLNITIWNYWTMYKKSPKPPTNEH
jgi:hypothetical protein